jgi:excinuclease ABC subunit A
VIAQGTARDVERAPGSLIGPFLTGAATVQRRRTAPPADTGEIEITVSELYNLHEVSAAFPVNGISALAGPSGAGKTALVLDSLVPAGRARLAGRPLPGHVAALDLGPIRQIVGIDASPIGHNSRSTPATYSGAWDHVRRLFADTPLARRRHWRPGHFSFNTREGQCPTCRGLGSIDLDVQYLPDINVTCPTCLGARFTEDTLNVQRDGLTIAGVLELTAEQALERFADQSAIANALRPMVEVGLGYLRLGEPTPALSGGEAQRLRIASRLRSSQRDVLYIFDEPSTGLRPLDIETLIAVFDRLLDDGATIVVIDHDLDVLAAADLVIDVGPGGGPEGGQIVARGTPAQIAADPRSVTGPYLARHLA